MTLQVIDQNKKKPRSAQSVILDFSNWRQGHIINLTKWFNGRLPGRNRQGERQDMSDQPRSHKLRILKTGHGDLCLAEWQRADTTSIDNARTLFEENFTAGRLAFRVDGPGRTSLLRAFDETAPEILIVPAIQGG